MSEALAIFSQEWADAAAREVNAGPTEQEREEKLDRFWEWIERAKEHLDLVWGLALDAGNGGDGRGVLLHLEQGRCTRAEPVSLAEARERADYLLIGSAQDWRDLADGFHAGKAVMYRKLVLDRGEVLDFFKSAYYWTESLACIQRVPTEV